MTMPTTAPLRVIFLAALALAPLAHPAAAQQAAPSPGGAMMQMAPGGTMAPMQGQGMTGHGMTGQGMMGMHISAPPSKLAVPVTSVVRK